MEAKDLKEKTQQELEKIVIDLKAQLFTLRFQNSTGQLKQHHKIKFIRRDIARVLTILSERKLQNKLDKTTPEKEKKFKKFKETKTKVQVKKQKQEVKTAKEETK